MNGTLPGAALLLLLLPCRTAGQSDIVVITEPFPSDAKYCAAVEPLRPNLVLTRDTAIRGRVIDQSGAPLQNSPIELRRFVSEAKQKPVKTFFTDLNGDFDLGVVKRGEYRLLLSPHRGFKQPENLECDPAKCSLDVTLVMNSTGQFAQNCPIR
jgi:hypothetical protein